MSSHRTYYEILEVETRASAAEIKRSYRRLVKRFHPDTSADSDATRLFVEIQRAYEVLSNPQRRTLYDAQIRRAEKVTSSALSLRLSASHSCLPLLQEPQVLYVVTAIEASPQFQASGSQRPSLNLCLVLDRSKSMSGQRLRQAKEAAAYLVDRLDDVDVLSVVIFSDRAKSIVRGQSGSNRTVARTAVESIYASGGTELLQGVRAGIDELCRWRRPGALDHLILLTDGHTYGDEADCLAAADAAGRDKIGMTLLGLGSDWNEQLLDDMATRSGGFSTYVDSPGNLVSVFKDRFGELGRVVARDVQLSLHLNACAAIRDVFRVTPDISRLQTLDGALILGSLVSNLPIRLLAEVFVEAHQPGPLRVLHARASGELMRDRTRQQVESEICVEVAETVNGAPAVAADVADLVARVALFKVQEKAIHEAESGDAKRAQMRLQGLATRLLNFGEVELARAALLAVGELERTGRLTSEGRKRIRYGTRNLARHWTPDGQKS